MKIKNVLALLLVLSICLCAAGCTKQTLIESYYSDTPVEMEIESTDNNSNDNSSDNKTSSAASGGASAATSTPISSEGKKAQGVYPDLSGKTVVRLLWEKVSTADKAIYDNFTKITGAQVKTTVTTYKNYFTKLSAMVAAGTRVDSAYMHQEHFPLMITKGLLMPVTKYVDKNDELLDFEFMNKFKWDGEYYGIQLKGTNQNHMVVFFNEDMFAEKGVKTPLQYYNEGNWNWNTFLELCKKMVEKDNKGDIKVYGCCVNDVMSFSCSTGKNIIDYDGKQLVNNIRDPDIIYAWKFIRDIAWGDNGYAIKDVGVLTDYLTNGKSAMAINGAFAVNRATTADSNSQLYKMKDKWDWVPFPTYVDQSGAVHEHYQPTCFCQWNVPKTAKEPEAGYWLNRFYLDPYKYEGSSFSESTIRTDADKKRLEKMYAMKSSADFIGGVTGAQESYDLIWDLQNKAAGDVDSVANSWKSRLDNAIKSCLKG